LTGADSAATYDEDWLQDLLFKHPESLPLVQIDPSFANPIPVVRELRTDAGPLDVLYVTPKGKIVVVEAKLWRNPEAHRKVIGQILDYAKELSHWKLDYLEREVSRRLRDETGKVTRLYELVRHHPEALEEAEFNDAVTRGLRRGEFMLLIVGDGIREGASAIAEFVEHSGTLHFTFGMVEMAVYRMPENRLLLCPRVLAQTAIVRRTVISLESERLVATVDGESDESPDTAREGPAQLSELASFYQEFWTEFVDDLRLDDPVQPLPKVTRVGNAFLPMPPNSFGWITLYFWQQQKEVGIFLTFQRGAQADFMYSALENQKDEIEHEVGEKLEWQSNSGKHRIGLSTKFADLRSDVHRPAIKAWLADRANKFVNAFRPRIERLLSEQ